MRTTAVKGSCPNCYRRMISATDVFGEETPMHGDLAICPACNQVAMFDFRRGRRNHLRKPTPEEAIAIETNCCALRLKQHQEERRLH